MARDQIYFLQNDFIVWKNGTDEQIAPNFHIREFECPMSRLSLISLVLVDRLQLMRDVLGFPLKITSAYRSAKKQDSLRAQGYKTAKDISQHEVGRAVDISLEGLSDKQKEALKDLATKYFMSVGIAKTFIHVDLRDDKIRTWGY